MLCQLMKTGTVRNIVNEISSALCVSPTNSARPCKEYSREQGLASNPGSLFRILSCSSDFSPKLRDKIRNGEPGFEAKQAHSAGNVSDTIQSGTMPSCSVQYKIVYAYML